jgi:hypothetical protein
MLSRSNFIKLLGTLSNKTALLNQNIFPASGISVRFKWNDTVVPVPGKGYYRRNVHFPEKYTLKPIPYTNLAGRDPKTGIN